MLACCILLLKDLYIDRFIRDCTVRVQTIWNLELQRTWQGLYCAQTLLARSKVQTPSTRSQKGICPFYRYGGHLEFYCFDWEIMGCRGGNRWKIYRIHSFQEKFFTACLSYSITNITSVTSFRHDIWQLFLWLSKNYCEKLSRHSILFNYFSSAPWASHNFLGIQDGRRIGKKVYCGEHLITCTIETLKCLLIKTFTAKFNVQSRDTGRLQHSKIKELDVQN